MHSQAAMSHHAGSDWAVASARTLARRLRRKWRQQAGLSQAAALVVRTKALREALHAHWRLGDQLGCHFAAFRETLNAASLLMDHDTLDDYKMALRLGNWARHSPPPGMSGPPPVPVGALDARAVEEFRAKLFGESLCATGGVQEDQVEGRAEHRGLGKPADIEQKHTAKEEEDNEIENPVVVVGSFEPCVGHFPLAAKVDRPADVEQKQKEEDYNEKSDEKEDPGEEEQGVRGGEQVEVQPGELGDEGHSLSSLRHAQGSLREGKDKAPPCRIVECSQGHPLHGTYADGAFRCDGCRTSIWKGRNMMYCEGCDYSVCLLCHTQDSQFARLVDLGNKKVGYKKPKKETG